MKKVFLCLLIIAGSVFAQVPKDYKGNYKPLLMKSFENVMETDSTSTFIIPSEIKDGIFYYDITEITISDTIKTIVQGSPDGLKWVDLSTTVIANNPVLTRVVVTNLDKYIRIKYNVGGPHPDIFGKLYLYPKL